MLVLVRPLLSRAGCGAVLVLQCVAGVARVAAADPADVKWSSSFGAPGLEGEIKTAVNWSGTLVVGGQISYAGGTRVHNVVSWSGTEFAQLGAGLDSTVTSLTVVGTTLYAAGDFTASGATPLPHVARWTGSAWTAVGSGAPDEVENLSLAADGSNLLLLGRFSTVGAPPVAAENIASWNGSAWSSVGGFTEAPGGYGFLSAAARQGSNLYVGGSYRETSSLHSYNGATWTYDVGGVDGDVVSLAVLGSDLYVHGSFSSVDAGNVSAEQIARWNGVSFSSLDDVSPGGEIKRIGVDNGQIFAVGTFLNDPGPLCSYWNGTNWDGGPARIAGPNSFGGGPSLQAFARVGGDLFLGGQFTGFYDYTQGGVVKGARNIAAWNGTQYRSLGTGFGVSDAGGYVRALASFDNKLIAAGEFDRIGTIGDAQSIASWNGTQWSSLGTGLNDNFGNPSGDDLATWNGRVVVSGYFTGGGAVNSRNIIAWNGTGWEGFAGGLNGQGARLVDFASQLVATGLLEFEVGSGNPLGHVARWTGTQWLTIGTVAPSSGASATKPIVWNGKLVCAGLFTSINGVGAINIAQWNGTSWSALGNGLNGLVTALGVYNGDLYASGIFTASGATPLPGFMARWNGTAWVAVGTGLDVAAERMASAGGKLFVTGQMGSAGGNSAKRIAAWDGAAWSALGSGLASGYGGNGQSPLCLVSHDGGLFAGGFFNTAGDKSSRAIARWDLGTSTGVEEIADGLSGNASELRLSLLSRNPASGAVELSLQIPSKSHVKVVVFDVRGRVVRTLLERDVDAGAQRLSWNGRDDAGSTVGTGVYWIRVSTADAKAGRKVVWVR